jgi:hypothetical protein
MNMEHCWYDTDLEKNNTQKKNLTQWHCPPQISHKPGLHSDRLATNLSHGTSWKRLCCSRGRRSNRPTTLEVTYFQKNKCYLFFRFYTLNIVTKQEGWKLCYWQLVPLYIVTFHGAIVGTFWKKFKSFISLMCPSHTTNIIPTWFWTNTV